MATRKKIISISIDQEILDKLYILCELQGRNASNMVSRLIYECFAEMPEKINKELEKIDG